MQHFCFVTFYCGAVSGGEREGGEFSWSFTVIGNFRNNILSLLFLTLQFALVSERGPRGRGMNFSGPRPASIR